MSECLRVWMFCRRQHTHSCEANTPKYSIKFDIWYRNYLSVHPECCSDFPVQNLNWCFIKMYWIPLYQLYAWPARLEARWWESLKGYYVTSSKPDGCTRLIIKVYHNYIIHCEHGKWKSFFFTMFSKLTEDWYTCHPQVYKCYLHSNCLTLRALPSKLPPKILQILYARSFLPLSPELIDKISVLVPSALITDLISNVITTRWTT